MVDGYRRRSPTGPGCADWPTTNARVASRPSAGYLDTIPAGRRDGGVTFDVLDVVGKSGFGIGSAGLPAYNVLIEGFSQALDNDVVLTLKQGNVAAPSRVVDDDDVAGLFEHHGHRTAVSQRALQAHADRFLGWTDLPGTAARGRGFVVSEYSPYEADLDWGRPRRPRGDGRAGRPARPGDREDPLRRRRRLRARPGRRQRRGAWSRRASETTPTSGCEPTEFAHAYAEQVRTDHVLFVDAFRSGAFADVAPA